MGEFSNSLQRIFYILVYDLRKYYLKAPVISWGLLFPLTIVLIVGMEFGIQRYSRMIPVGFVISLLFASTSIVHASIAFEKMSGAINLALFLPIKTYELVASKVLGGLFYGFIGVGVAGGLYYILTGGVVFVNPWFFVYAAILGSIVFSLITVITAYSLEPIKAIAVLNIIRFTMLFIGGLLVPFQIIPFYVRFLIYVFPSLYIVNLIKYSLYNEWECLDPYTSLIILLIYTALLLYVSNRIVIRVLVR